MASTPRQKSPGSWEIRVKNKLLPKPIWQTFDTQEEARTWANRVEQDLAKGVVPEWLVLPSEDFTLGGLIDVFMKEEMMPESRKVRLGLVKKDWKSTRLAVIDYQWVKRVVDLLKSKRQKPTTIQRYVGALAMCIDYAKREKYAGGVFDSNPVRQLPAGYALYADNSVIEVERDRRLDEDEEKKIVEALTNRHEFRMIFLIAIETAMRLSEVYTLQPTDIDHGKRTIFLRKEMTKTGVARQIPMSSVLVRELVDFQGFGHFQKSERLTSRYSRWFSRLFERLEIKDFNFHDLRHEATCRFILRTKFSDIQIMRITGHRSPKEFLRYASLRGSELVDEMW